MIKIKLTFICTLFSTSIHIYAETGKPPDPEAATRGMTTYTKHCQTCHGENGVGEPRIPWSIRRPGYNEAPALNDTQHAWHHSDENLVKMIQNGFPPPGRMPAWKNIISIEESRDLVAYIKSLWGARAIECQGPKHMSCM